MKEHLLELPLGSNPEKWTRVICVECGQMFYVRNCYLKRGQGKFCSISCGTKYRNKHDNPLWREDIKEKIIKNLWWAQKEYGYKQGRGFKLSQETCLKISQKVKENHHDVSGRNNPMYGRKGPLAPGYIDGRRIGLNGEKLRGDTWRCIALKHKKTVCEICGKSVEGREMHVHHKDKNRKNNNLNNLQVVCVKCHNLILHERPRDKFGRFTKEVI